MDLQHLTMTEFVLLQAEWSAEESRLLIEQLEPSHVIVHRSDPQAYYYLFTSEEVLPRFASAPDGSSVRKALNLHEYTATPALEIDTDAELAPNQCVVLEHGFLVGFYDVCVPPQPIAWRRGGNGNGEPASDKDVARSLVAELPEKVPLHVPFSLLVFLSAAPTPETGAALPITLPLGTTIDILVQPRRGFVLEGSGEGQLVISREEETLPLQFKVRGVTVGPGQLRVLAFHQWQPLGALTLTVTVLEAEATIDLPPYSQEQQPLARVSIHQPDLQVLIQELEVSGKPAFIVRLTAQDPTLELNLKPFGPVPLQVDALRYFQEFFQEIEDLPLNSDEDKAIARQKLADKGASLFDLLPTDLQLLLWTFRSRIQSVQVQSEEPWIPWELCKLAGPDEKTGQDIKSPFLCEAFALTRWLPGTPMKPDLKLTKMAVVVPRDSGLSFAASERDYLLSLSGGNRQVQSIPARFLDLHTALASGEYDGWHFSGHGGFYKDIPNSSTMYLENKQTFTPEALSNRLISRNLRRTKPLVFLNACQIGRSAMSLTAIGGWASQFLRAGAGAFIGAYWSIYDKPALDFAQALYSRLLAGMSIGRAVQEARTAIKPAGDPTWLAYTVFADPLATVREGISSPQ